MLEGLHFFGEGIGRIVWRDGAAFLEDDAAIVVFFVDEMDGDAAFGIAGGQYGFVHEMAVHAFAAIVGQEGGVYINNTSFESLHEIGGHFPKETGKHHEVYLLFLQQFNVGIAAEELFFIDQDGGDMFFLRYFEDAGFRFVGYDEGDLCQG